MRYQNQPEGLVLQRGLLAPRANYGSKYREAVYEAICGYAVDHGGNTPTVRELCEIVGISSTSVAGYNVHQLIKQGLLEIVDRKLVVVGGVWTPPTGGGK